MDTISNIVAPATAIGGAITIIRLSGPDVLAISRQVWKGHTSLGEAPPRTMLLGKVGLDQALAVYMKSPASYTGDDVVELHCHGGAVAAEQALKLALEAGCRMAEPGEFTFRAFANGKIDLVQAEAVADIISAGSTKALKLAEKQLEGYLSTKLEVLFKELEELRAESESHLDFPDEELEWNDGIPMRIRNVEGELQKLLATRNIGVAIRDGVNLVIAGRPNTGKSSLMNRLLGQDRAIVTPIPGTTRDTIEAFTVLRDLPVRITDTAGIRTSDDPVEQLGVERARQSIQCAQITFWLLDASSNTLEQEIEDMKKHSAPGRIAIWNKIDLVPNRKLPDPGCTTVPISVLADEGIDTLLDVFAQMVTGTPAIELPEVAINSRHASLLEKATEMLPEAATRFENGEYELVGQILRNSQHKLGEIIGNTAEPDVLDYIFSRFCLGK